MGRSLYRLFSRGQASTVLFCALATVASASDAPTLESGFPAPSFQTPGTGLGHDMVPLITQLDADPELEILYSPITTTQIYAVDHDGSIKPGWPLGPLLGTSWAFSMGELDAARPGRELAIRQFESVLRAIDQNGDAVPGWPLDTMPGWPPGTAQFTMTFAPVVADLDGDGLDEVLVDSPWWHLWALDQSGQPKPGWPKDTYDVAGCNGPWLAPTIADLDLDGTPEIVAATATSNVAVPACVHVFRADGSEWAGFPKLAGGYLPPMVVNADADPELEIVVSGYILSSPFTISGHQLYVYDGDGSLIRTIASSIQPFRGVPADLDGDGVQELVIKGMQLEVFRMDGTRLPNWPQSYISEDIYSIFYSPAPTVGDVDGDGAVDIVVGGAILDRHGFSHPATRGQRSSLPFPPAVPPYFGTGIRSTQIADIDLDGRNEVIYDVTAWNGFTGWHPQVFALDFGGPAHGPLLAGRIRADEGRTNHFPPTPALPTSADLKLSINSSVPASLPGEEIVLRATVTVAAGSDTVAPTLTFNPQPVQTGGNVSDVTAYGLRLASSPRNAGCETRARKVFCPLGSIAAGQSVTREVGFVADAVGPVRLAVAVDAAAAEKALSDNFKVVDTVVESVDLLLAQKPAGKTRNGKNIINFTLRNSDPRTATGIVVSAPLPVNTTFVSATIQGGSCALSAGSIRCNLATLGPTQSAEVSVTLKSKKKPSTYWFQPTVTAVTRDADLLDNTIALRVKAR